MVQTVEFVKTTDLEPCEGQKCLVFVDGLYVVTYFTKYPFEAEHGFFCEGFAFDDNEFVYGGTGETYWMPLPADPRK